MKCGALPVARIGVLAAACGALIWHVMNWQAAGVYADMLRWGEHGIGHLAGLYGLALMLVSGAVLACLLGGMSNLIGRGDHATTERDRGSVRHETCIR